MNCRASIKARSRSMLMCYQLYRTRLIDKIRIMREEIKYYGQVLQCHQNIDGNLKANRKNNVQNKNKLLESYKVESLAKQYRKASEKIRDREQQQEMLRNCERLMQEERNKSKEKKEFQKLFLNKSQVKYQLGQKYKPGCKNKMVNSLKRYEPNALTNPQGSISFINKVRLPRINMTHIMKKQVIQEREQHKRPQRSILLQK